jgi:hypothetical protein
MTCRSRWAATFSAFVLLATLTGCGEDKCPEHGSDPPIEIEDGNTDLDALIYESAPWGGPLHEFTPNTPLAFRHGLGHTPEIVSTYVSFSSNGTDGSNVSENAGNQGLIKCVDADVIVMVNDTCEPNLYIRVAASASPSAPTDEKCLTE